MKARSVFSHDFKIALGVVLLLSLVIVAVFAFSERLTDEDRLYVPKATRLTPELELLQEYIRIDTTNPPGNELAGAQFLAARLRREGLEPEIITTAPGRANLYCRLKGERAGKGLMLLHHIDVVAATAAGWKRPPFAGEIVLNDVYGRGTLDMKGIGICQLLAFIDVARSGKKPPHDLVLLAVADEEQGGKFGMEWLTTNRPDIFEGVTYAMNEGGITEMVAEKVIYFGVETGSRQFVTLEASSADRAALERFRIELEPRFNPHEADRILPEVEEYFKTIAKHRLENREVFQDIRGTVARGELWRLNPTYRALMQNTLFADGVVESGNVFTMRVIMSNLPDEDPAAGVNELTRLAGRFDTKVRTVQSMGPTRISSTTTPFFQLLKREIIAEIGPAAVGPMILPNVTTDSRYLRARGIEAYGFWPYPVDFFQTQSIHGPNERLRTDWFMRGLVLTKRIVSGYGS